MSREGKIITMCAVAGIPITEKMLTKILTIIELVDDSEIRNTETEIRLKLAEQMNQRKAVEHIQQPALLGQEATELDDRPSFVESRFIKTGPEVLEEKAFSKTPKAKHETGTKRVRRTKAQMEADKNSATPAKHSVVSKPVASKPKTVEPRIDSIDHIASTSNAMDYELEF